MISTENQTFLVRRLKDLSKRYYEQDKELARFCDEHLEEYGIMNLTSYAYKVKGSDNSLPKPAILVGMTLNEISDVVSQLVESGFSHKKCMNITEKILNKN